MPETTVQPETMQEGGVYNPAAQLLKDMRESRQQAMAQSQPNADSPEDTQEQAGVVDESQEEEVQETTDEDPPDDTTVSGEDEDDPSLEQDSPDDSFFSQWDAIDNQDADKGEDSPETTTQTVSDAPDYQSLAKKLGIEAKSEEDIVNAFKTTAKSALEGVPEELVHAVELSKSGLDYQSFLQINQVDWSSLDPEQVYLADLRNEFTDSKGNFNEEGYDEYINSIPLHFAKIEGRKKINQLVKEQKEQNLRFQQQQEAVKKQREQARLEDQKRLLSAVDDLKDISGFKLDDRHKNALKRQLQEGGFQKIFTNDKGEVDYRKAVDLYAKGIYFDRVVEYQQSKFYNNGKRDVLSKATNANVKTTSERPDPQKTPKENAVQRNLRLMQERQKQ